MVHFNGTEAQPANQPDLPSAGRLLATLGLANTARDDLQPVVPASVREAHQKKTMRTLTRLLMAVLVTTSLSACAVRYGPRIPGIQPGYVEQRLGEATYQIKIGEAWPKDWPDLEKFAMYRAAETTKAHGQRYFAVLEATTQVSSYEITSPAIATTQGTANRIGNTTFISATTTVTPARTSTISGGWYTLEYRILTSDELKQYTKVIDSDQVIMDLRYFIDSRR